MSRNDETNLPLLASLTVWVGVVSLQLPYAILCIGLQNDLASVIAVADLSCHVAGASTAYDENI